MFFGQMEVLEKRDFKGPGPGSMALTKAAAQCCVCMVLPPPSDAPKEERASSENVSGESLPCELTLHYTSPQGAVSTP